MTTTPIPSGYATLTPYLVVPDAVALFAFLVRAMTATEVRRTSRPDGSVLNIEVRIGSSMMMLVQGRPEHDVRTTASYVYVPNVDEAYAQAISAGGASTMSPQDQFYGDRGAGFRDPVGNDWWLATRIEDLSDEDLARRVVAPEFRRH
jgi:PhnB protein